MQLPLCILAPLAIPSFLGRLSVRVDGGRSLKAFIAYCSLAWSVCYYLLGVLPDAFLRNICISGMSLSQARIEELVDPWSYTKSSHNE